MRTLTGVAMLFLAAILAVPAWGQSGASTFFTGVNPRQVKFEPINVQAAMSPFHANQQAGFGMLNFFRKIGLPLGAPKLAHTPILTKSPYQPTVNFGNNANK